MYRQWLRQSFWTKTYFSFHMDRAHNSQTNSPHAVSLMTLSWDGLFFKQNMPTLQTIGLRWKETSINSNQMKLNTKCLVFMSAKGSSYRPSCRITDVDYRSIISVDGATGVNTGNAESRCPACWPRFGLLETEAASSRNTWSCIGLGWRHRHQSV